MAGSALCGGNRSDVVEVKVVRVLVASGRT